MIKISMMVKIENRDQFLFLIMEHDIRVNGIPY